MANGSKGLMLSRRPKAQISLCKSCQWGKEFVYSLQNVIRFCEKDEFPSSTKQQCRSYKLDYQFRKEK